MTDDIVAQLRLYSQRMKGTRSMVLGMLLSAAADDIERLRRELDEANSSNWVGGGALQQFVEDGNE